MSTAFPIQSATIADALAGRDVLGKARTGSGKTLGFGLPAIARLAETGRPEPHKPRAIVLVPTRELAMQVNDSLEPFAHAMHVSLRLVAGGLSMSKQIRSLERGVHLLVATPGRLADLVRRGAADVSDVQMVVLDEADHMADMGFMDEIEEVLSLVPAGGQRLLFSATLDGDVDRLVTKYMEDPVLHDVTDGDDQPSTMRHVVLHVPPHAKYQIANRIAARQVRTIVFVRTKLACDRIAEQMRDAGVLAVALHGDKSQHDRNHAITGFRAGQIPVLVATDVAARGIHVDHVDLVLQLDPPADHKDYTHRSGRTARAGESGLVVTLALPHQRRTMERLIERTGVDAESEKLRGEDERSLATLMELTGAQEPSGEPVREPRPDRGRGDFRRGRGGPQRGDRGPSRGDRGGYRGDRGGARGDRDRRPSHSRSAMADGPSASHQSAKARAQFEQRERDLAAREAELRLREESLAAREREASAPRDDRGRGRPASSGKPRYDRNRDERGRHERGRYDGESGDRGRYSGGRDERGSYSRDDDRRQGRRDDRDSGGYKGGKSGARKSHPKSGGPAAGAKRDGKSSAKGGGKGGKSGKGGAPMNAKPSRRGKPRSKKKR